MRVSLGSSYRLNYNVRNGEKDDYSDFRLPCILCYLSVWLQRRTTSWSWAGWSFLAGWKKNNSVSFEHSTELQLYTLLLVADKLACSFRRHAPKWQANGRESDWLRCRVAAVWMYHKTFYFFSLMNFLCSCGSVFWVIILLHFPVGLVAFFKIDIQNVYVDFWPHCTAAHTWYHQWRLMSQSQKKQCKAQSMTLPPLCFTYQLLFLGSWADPSPNF